MIVPSYVPDPVEVADNVTEEPYGRRLIFIRAVALRHGLLVAATTTIALSPVGSRLAALFPLALSVAILFGVFIALDLWRIARRGRRIEARAAAASAPFVVLVLAVALRDLSDAGWPVAAPLAGEVAAGFYLALCGRDLSFVGLFLAALLASSAALLAWGVPPLALLVNAAALLYGSYDLASLLSRRRVGEEWAAAVDLFRDVFNVFGYVPRVLRHWRRHRIWDDLPRPEILSRGPFAN